MKTKILVLGPLPLSLLSPLTAVTVVAVMVVAMPTLMAVSALAVVEIVTVRHVATTSHFDCVYCFNDQFVWVLKYTSTSVDTV